MAKPLVMWLFIQLSSWILAQRPTSTTRIFTLSKHQLRRGKLIILALRYYMLLTAPQLVNLRELLSFFSMVSRYRPVQALINAPSRNPDPSK